ncbi:MAG: TM2 domain-containing protein [Bacteroidia bacterium]|nr:TM2 domain-containing protein [Bacteroidia bacterium]MDW8346260.1 NINE protein [Bacteroidia bacterium]
MSSCSNLSAELSVSQVFWMGKNKWITAFLALIGGSLGLHRLYLGHYKAALFHFFCTLLSFYALSFIVTGSIVFPVIFLLLFLSYVAVGILGRVKNIRAYLKPFQDMILALMFIPLFFALLWFGLIVAFSGSSVYFMLVSSIFTLFSLFLSFRYAIISKRGFIERFYKNRSIWH